VGKRLSRDGKRDDSEAATSVVLCNLRIVPEYFCSSGDVHPSVVTVGILMCLMPEEGRARKLDVLRGGPTMSNTVPGRLDGHGEQSKH
jgi:hypothetical protein